MTAGDSEGFPMMIRDAQRDIRSAYLGGFAGQLVSGTIWLLSAALGTWDSQRQAILALVVGGFFIFPLTLLVLRAMRRPASLPPGHPFNGLAMQVAFTVPLGLPLVGAATLHHAHWFYPAFMILVGAHYLPFVFLYGMPMFAGLCALLVGGGLALGLYVPVHAPFSLGGWFTGAVLVVFAFVGRGLAAHDGRPAPGAVR
jgi:hypothetical protein